MLSMDANAKKDNGLERLQKIMASSGVASRRKCEEMIKAGRVTVNGKVITELGFKASYSDEIRVDGSQIAREDKVYYVMNKPTGYLTTVSDDRGRRTVMDIFEDYDRQNRIFPIGRLDYDSSGCLLFTNDGELAAKLTKSSNNIEKEYVVRVKGRLEQKDLVKIRRGIEIDGKVTKPSKAAITDYDKEYETTQVRMIITEGRNREIRKVFDALGFEVKKLKRVRFGNVTCEGLALGKYRPLKIHEVKTLYSL
jgi:23S rRNA pseudouridine2605 synthase